MTLGPDHDRECTRLAAALVLGRLAPEEVVRFAAEVVASGADGEAIVALASMPADRKQLRTGDVEELLRVVLAEAGWPSPSEWEAGWIAAAFIAAALIEGQLRPGAGALALWNLWHTCGEPDDELTWMLQLHDAWEQSVGDALSSVEAEIVAYAPRVIAAARTKVHDPYELPEVSVEQNLSLRANEVHQKTTHERWVTRRHRRSEDPSYKDEWWAEQCGRCRFWVPLSGRWGLDHGACTNERSPLDQRVTFEHDGCERFEDAVAWQVPDDGL